MNGPFRSALLLIVVAFASVWWTPVSAIENDTFGLEPDPVQTDGTERTTFVIPLEPGAVFEDQVRVFNKTNQPLDLVVYAADAESTPNDTDITPGFRTNRPKGVGSWIKLARETVALAARDEVIITFQVEVKTSEPSPNLGAIVVENTAAGSADERSQREFLAVRTGPPNSETASVRVRPLLLRSPWIVVAMLGVVVAIALVWIGARRARRPKDVLVPAGEIDQPELDEDAPEASRPVIKRLGASEVMPPEAPVQVLTRAARSDDRPLLDDAFLVEIEPDADDEDEDLEAHASVTGEVDTYDEDEVLEDDLEEDDEDFDDEEDEEDEEDDEEEDLPPARTRTTRPATAAKKKPAPKKSAQRKTATKKKEPARKKAAPKKPSHPAAKKRAPARKASPAKKEAPPAYIPLDDL